MEQSYCSVENKIHPGFLLNNYIKENGLTIKKASELLGVTRCNLSNIVNGKRDISCNMAIRLEIVFEIDASYLILKQYCYNLTIAKSKPNYIGLKKYKKIKYVGI